MNNNMIKDKILSDISKCRIIKSWNLVIKKDLKIIAFDGIDKTTRKIEVIEFMLSAIQTRKYHLHFCYKHEAAFAGEAEKIEHNLLRDCEEDLINKLKQMLQEEQKSLDTYDYLLTGKKQNKNDMEKVINNNGYGYVDLGLPSGTLWATCNVGADKPTDYGLYFQWGDTVGYTADQIGKDKQFNWSDCKWRLSGDSYSNIAFTKYTNAGATLNLEDDAANANLGGDWHMPTPQQIQELISNTDTGWTTSNGTGMTFTSRTDKTKSIFIPAAGYAKNGTLVSSGGGADVWSSMLDASNVGYGQHLFFYSYYIGFYSGNRYCGYSVRGVIG